MSPSTLLCWLLFVLFCNRALSECCGHISFVGHGNGMEGICCGQGSCNIFCCNCEGGCQPNLPVGDCTFPYGYNDTRLMKRRQSSDAASALFDRIDRNYDGKIDFEEALQSDSGLAGSPEDMKEGLDEIDKNHDGFVDRKEFDSSK